MTTLRRKTLRVSITVRRSGRREKGDTNFCSRCSSDVGTMTGSEAAAMLAPLDLPLLINSGLIHLIGNDSTLVCCDSIGGLSRL